MHRQCTDSSFARSIVAVGAPFRLLYLHIESANRSVTGPRQRNRDGDVDTILRGTTTVRPGFDTALEAGSNTQTPSFRVQPRHGTGNYTFHMILLDEAE